jgi:DNA-binding CsgD family transcriptional regulator
MARILAAADSYQAMRARRPHRPALDAAGAEDESLRDAREGRLCPEAVDAVLAAAGHRVVKRPRELPAGLTDRELEVLLALAAGVSNEEIAEALRISAKTVGHHVVAAKGGHPQRTIPLVILEPGATPDGPGAAPG